VFACLCIGSVDLHNTVASITAVWVTGRNHLTIGVDDDDSDAKIAFGADNDDVSNHVMMMFTPSFQY